MSEALPALMNEAAAARYLGKSVITLRRWRRAGQIGYKRVGHTVYYTEAHLRAYLEAHECPATGSPTNTPSSNALGRRSGISNGGTEGKRNAALRAVAALTMPSEPPAS